MSLEALIKQEVIERLSQEQGSLGTVGVPVAEWTSSFWDLLSQRTRLPPDDCPHILGNIRNNPGDLGNDLMKDKRFGNYAGEAFSQETRAFAGWPYFDFRLKRTEDMRVTVIPKRMCSYVQSHAYLVLTNGIKLFARESYTSAVIE